MSTRYCVIKLFIANDGLKCEWPSLYLDKQRHLFCPSEENTYTWFFHFLQAQCVLFIERNEKETL